MTNLTITARSGPAGHVLSLQGDLDMATAPALRQACEDLTYTAGQELVLDLSRLGFCDSSGVSAFIVACRHVESFGAGFALAAAPRSLTRVLAMIGLSDFFTQYDTVDPDVTG
ncbi:STAS domain-containing protein [Kutzneria kofuensis]|uniref:Anti-sigma factor antagonist n=1 Tax=Kutzneria kofuensis TaxID=103725 RepID=A0A7W9KPF8_9PSEU|nr:STAS domain-containing protein [Kutzneria kofuensis]MBB5896028.1 anti-anti-sigma factor [Kutzneria kofuensis]